MESGIKKRKYSDASCKEQSDKWKEKYTVWGQNCLLRRF